MRKLSMAALLTVSIAACSPIQSKPYVSQPVGQSLRVGVGGVIVHVDRKRNLENAFGKADVFGRKTYEGFSELRFMGVQKIARSQSAASTWLSIMTRPQ